MQKNAQNRETLIRYRLAHHTICHMRRRLKNKSYIHEVTSMSIPNRSILYDPTTLQGVDEEMLGDKIQNALRMTVIAKMRERERERERERKKRKRDQLKNVWVENITLEK